MLFPFQDLFFDASTFRRPGVPGRSLTVRVGHSSSKGSITRVFRIGEDNEKTGQLDQIMPNHIVRVNVDTHEKIAITAFGTFADLGRLVVIDPETGDTVGAGVIAHTLRRGDNIVEHEFDIGASRRQEILARAGKVLRFTGLSGSGKSTLANGVSIELANRGIPHTILDSDSLRKGLNKDLGFTESDRVENIRRTAEVAKLMADSGLTVLVSLISPHRADRERARETIGPERFFEVFVDTPLEICEFRDPKGLYQRARQGLIQNFTGVGGPYEVPQKPELRCSGAGELMAQVTQILSFLSR